jgi:hypothetical protein
MSNLFHPDGRFLLFGELHSNSKQFASCCEESGADAVIFHLNLDSPGMGRFGGLEIEEDSIRDALSTIRIPAGISIGDTRTLFSDDWESIAKLGFSFVNMFAHQLPTFAWQDSRVEKLVSIGPGYVFEQVRALSEFDNVSGIEAALTPNQGLGMPMTLLDATTLKLVTKLSAKPIFLPTQRDIQTQDLRVLKELGCSGILINGSSYGDTEETCREQFSRFRAEITRLQQVIVP